MIRSESHVCRRFQIWTNLCQDLPHLQDKSLHGSAVFERPAETASRCFNDRSPTQGFVMNVPGQVLRRLGPDVRPSCWAPPCRSTTPSQTKQGTVAKPCWFVAHERHDCAAARHVGGARLCGTPLLSSGPCGSHRRLGTGRRAAPPPTTSGVRRRRPAREYTEASVQPQRQSGERRNSRTISTADESY